jgi:hypothetical protein
MPSGSRAFRLAVNGQPICVAGVGEVGVLSAHLITLRGTLDFGHILLYLGALDDARGHMGWTVPAIAMGDTITIDNIESDAVDPPSTSRPREQSAPPSRLDGVRQRIVTRLRAMAANPTVELAALGRDLRAAFTQAVPGNILLGERLPPTMLKVSVNDRHVCAERVPYRGNLTATLTWVGRANRPPHRTRLSVHGLDSEAHESCHWSTPLLDVGDRIYVQVLPAQRCDEPSRVVRRI